jgi:PadR family transcriptional regulator PadR
MLLLHMGLSHGYALLERLDEFGLGHVDPSAVYRTLRGMEAQGWVTSTWDENETQGPPRRVYRLTASGDEALASWIGDLVETQRHIEHVLESYDRHMREGQGEHHGYEA